MTDRVYRTATGRIWHWPHPDRITHRSACTAWPLTDHMHTLPVSVPMADRCAGPGCRQRWEEWFRRTVHAALVDELARCRPTSQQETPA
ncbi:MAG: hypothetical protein JWO67_3336 [Streptosporangiaceae bacterium]|nr:hypothetical protein [Streptosporangiaceae bacterium]